MITCNKCGAEFQSIWQEHYPGAASTGIALLISGAIQIVMGVVLLIVGQLYGGKLAELYLLFGTLATLHGLLVLAGIPQNRQSLISHGGNRCPQCDTINDIRWFD